MRIVHYTLGIYPYRLGGLNRYATDLMYEQAHHHKITLLYPQGYRWWQNGCSISKSHVKNGINIYKLINSEPVSLLYGIRNDKNNIGKKIQKKSFEYFYDNVKPEVLHLHTMMGMPEEALRFFKNKGVKIVFTTHDYFGICPKVNFINKHGKLCETPIPKHCALCNTGSPSALFLRLRNSHIVFIIRDLVRWLKNTLN